MAMIVTQTTQWLKPSKLLPIKLHYLLFFGGQGAILPFLPVIAKQLGLSATALGLFYSLIPLPSFLAVPFVCNIADRFRATRLVLLLSIAVHALAYGGIACLPPVRNNSCSDDNNSSLFVDNETLFDAEAHLSIYGTAQCWLFMSMMILVWVTSGVTSSLADALCYRLLSGEESYGKQRLWGTVGWGAVGCVTGFFVASTTDYSTAYYLMAVLLATDLLNVSVMSIPDSRPSATPPSVRQMLSLLRHPTVLLFVLQVGVLGVLTGILWSYSFWFFQDLGADQTVMGLALAVQCFLGEVPFFFFSDRVIRRLGHFGSVSLSFLAFGVRYIGYPLVSDPWFLLPFELLHGPAYSLFYATMTSFAARIAPPGLEGSVQGLMTGTFEDLGAAFGGVLGGVLMDSVGGRWTFLSSGIASCFFCLACTISICFSFKDPQIAAPAKETAL